MRRFFRRIWRSWFPQHILMVTHRGMERRIHVKSFKKITQKHIKGVNMEDETFELRSTEPMDYYIEEYRDDLR